WAFARRDRSRALAIVRMARDRVLSCECACAIDDRRADGIVHHWISQHSGAAFARRPAAQRWRNFYLTCVADREQPPASRATTDRRGHGLSCAATLFPWPDGNARAKRSGVAATPFRVGVLWIPQCDRWHLSHRGGKTDDERPFLESTRRADVERRFRPFSDSWRWRIFLSKTSWRREAAFHGSANPGVIVGETCGDRSVERVSYLGFIFYGSWRLATQRSRRARLSDSLVFHCIGSLVQKAKWAAVHGTMFPAGRAAARRRVITSRGTARLSYG